MDGTRRLFVAVDLDEAARAAAGRVARQVAAALEQGQARGVRWVGAGLLHLTLAFMAAVPEADVAGVRDALETPMATAAFEAELRDVGLFPSQGPPRVVWIGIGDGLPALEALHADVRERLEARGIALESRPFSAHLTLGRWRESRASDRSRVQAAAPRGTLARFPVDRVTLYESHLSPTGPSHVPLAQSALGPRPGRVNQR